MVIVRIINGSIKEVNLECSNKSSVNLHKLIEMLELNKDIEYMVIGDGKVLDESEDICRYKKVIVTVLAEGG